MTVASVHPVERTVHKTNEWLNELVSELGTGDKDDAWRMLRGYLHVLRDRLTADEAAQLAAQFTHLIRGVYWEGFDPGHQPEKIRDADTFLLRLAEEAILDDPLQAGPLAAACTRVMARHVDTNELDEALGTLPAPIREILTAG